MTRSASERFDADPAAYAEYLRTPLGRLRAELCWRNLEPHLPSPGTRPRRALDLGAGNGETALRLAAAGWDVTLVDGSRRMLEQAAQRAIAQGLEARIACHALDLDLEGGRLAQVLGIGGYDIVVCHHLLEYVSSPEAVLRASRTALAAAGRVSLVVRNRAGEVLKCLLRSGDPGAALDVLAGGRVREELHGLEVRLFDVGEVRSLLGAAGLHLVAERGVRVVADHLPRWTGAGDDSFERVLELERRLSESAELGAVARYLQVIAAPA